jgi:hypothetical protein
MPDVGIKPSSLCREWAFIYDVVSFVLFNKPWRRYGRKGDKGTRPEHASRSGSDTAAVETGAEMRTN